MSQDDLKRIAAERAVALIPEDSFLGIGTGSTVNFFIEALAQSQKRVRGTVSTSAATTRLLQQHGFNVVSPTEAGRLPVYIDGADEINHSLHMVKGGGGALLAEKIVAHHAGQFICIADESKYVRQLGKFPLPVEVLPFARSLVAQEMVRLGGTPQLRANFATEAGHEILDVAGLNLDRPLTMEEKINQIPGVMENGIFARRPADILVLGRAGGAALVHAGE